ncbi:RHS repeat protein [Bradyrhizobium liaoningense]|uniref:RHS repeat protein n=1 Tax=Bradyrhizobium liaoningense TaxID=43992 RepID=UPI001BA60CC4|nr:RHS repeat protein [Bradyrhizobium liaoningense]MBR0842780.1 RHS repeat protein [Bradyrhizobium liaoningense]
MTTASPDQTILSASTFISSIGVNVHVGYSWGAYDNLALVEDNLRYLGVTKLRGGLAISPEAQPIVEGLAHDGYKFDLVVPSGVPEGGTAALQAYLESVKEFAAEHPGSVIALEGLNEVNIQGFTYNGSSSIAAAAQFQAAYYAAIKADAALKNIPVYNLSIGYNDLADYANLGDMSGSTDYANSHAYVSTGLTPETALEQLLGNAKSVTGGKPVVITETGYTTKSDTPYVGASENVQAKSILNTLVDAYKDGVSATYLYQLLDASGTNDPTNPESHWGLFNSDGTPKLAATALHNLTTILADDGKGGQTPTASLSYTLDNMPASGNSMVLGKSNGAYELVVWAEPKVWNDATDTEISNPTNSVTVNLGSVHHLISVYDPLKGTTPIATYTDVSQIVVPITDHPLIIEIDAPAGGGTTPPAVTDVSGTAEDIVSQMSELNASASLQTITLTDTHVLPVASIATMEYMISHYTKALAAIQGGYQFSITNSTDTWSVTRVYDSSARLVSTSTSNFTDGVITSKVTFNTDGSSENIAYTDGKMIRDVTVSPIGDKDTKTYDTNGNLIADLVQNNDGSTSNTLYSAGVKTKVYVTNADRTHDNYYYNITGQSYTSEHDHLDASGRLLSVVRTHADGSMAYSQVFNSDGSKVTTQYDSTGHKTSVITVTATATTTNFYTTAGALKQTVEQTSSGNVTTTNYNGSLLVSVYVVNADGSKDSKLYDSQGIIASDLVQNADGSSSNTVYAAGVKTTTYVTNADGSRDNYYYNITGQSYTSEHDHLDASGKLLSVVRTHADGTMAYSQVFNSDGSKVTTQYDSTGHKTSTVTTTSTATTTDFYTSTGALKQTVVKTTSGDVTTTNYNGSLLVSVYVVNADGSKDSKLYDSNGMIASDLVQNKDGSSSNTLYTAGVKTKAYVTNADGSRDNYYYNITGQSYTTEHDHIDPSGKLLLVSRTHADGSMAYSQVLNSDGSKVTTQYDSTGHKVSVVTVTTSATTTDTYDPSSGLLKQEIVKTGSGTTTTNYNGTLLASVYVVNADGSKDTKLYDSSGRIASDVVQNTDGSSSNTVYSAGVKSKVYVTNVDGSHDNYYYNITGQSYTTEIQHTTAADVLTSLTRLHADDTLAYKQVINSDGSKVTDLYDSTGHKTTEIRNDTDGSTTTDTYDSSGALKQDVHKTAGGDVTTTNYVNGLNSSIYVVNADGTKETKLFDSSGDLTSDYVLNKDGSNSTTVYSSGVKNAVYVNNADGSHDNTIYNITGKSYVTEQQHIDASGKMTSITRSHADGTLDYTQVIKSDGSKTTDVYDSTGVKTTETLNNADGTTDVFKFKVSGLPGAVEHDSYNSNGSLLTIDVLNTDGTHAVTAVTAGLTLAGGGGNDVFSTAPGTTTVMFDGGNDQIKSFHAGTASNHDTIEILKSLVADYSHLQISQSGSDTLIQLTSADSILLKNVNSTTLDHGNFLFV